MDGGHRLDSSMGDGNWLDFSPGLGIDLIFVGAENDMDFVWRSQKKYGCVSIEMKLVFVSGRRDRLGIGVGIEIGLISVMGSKLTWFWCAGSRVTWC